MSVSKKIAKAADGPAPKAPKAKAADAAPSRVRGKTAPVDENMSRTDGSEAAGDGTLLAGTGQESATRVNISPAARKRAEELGLDISTLKGTGKGGIVTKTDVENASKADVEKFLDNNAPVPGTMGVLQKGQLETGPDYGAIGMSDEDLAKQYLTALVDAANAGTGGDMIRALSQFSRNQPLRAPEPVMDMSRLNSSLFPKPAPVNGDFAALSAENFPGPAATPGDVPIGNPDGVLDPSRMAAPQFQYASPDVISSALDMSGLSSEAFPPPGGRTMDMSRLREQDFPPPAPVPGDPALPPSSGAMDMSKLAGAASGAPPEPTSKSDAFMASRGLGGMLGSAARGVVDFAKAHPYFTTFGALGAGSLAAANMSGGGGTEPTPEEMAEHDRRRREAWNRAAQPYSQQNAAPSAPMK